MNRIPLAELCGISAARRRGVAGPLEARGRLADREVATLLATVDRPVFTILPSPAYLALLAEPSGDPAAITEIGSRLAEILRTEIRALAAQGVPYVALGNPLCVPLLTRAGQDELSARGYDPGALLEAVLASIGPPSVTSATYPITSAWAST